MRTWTVGLWPAGLLAAGLFNESSLTSSSPTSNPGTKVRKQLPQHNSIIFISQVSEAVLVFGNMIIT